MQVKSIGYSMLRVVKTFENDRVEVVIELTKTDKIGDAVREAKRICDAALKSKTETFEACMHASRQTGDRW